MEAQAGLYRFLREVDTGRGQRDSSPFWTQYLDSMRSPVVREWAKWCWTGRGGHCRPCCAPTPDRSRSGRGNSPGVPAVYTGTGRPAGGTALAGAAALHPVSAGDGQPLTACLCCAPCPSSAGILLKIYQALGQNWEAGGQPALCSGMQARGRGRALRPGAGTADRPGVVGRHAGGPSGEQCGTLWQLEMWDIKVIGADSQVLDSEVPVRQILEQLIARTGIPPLSAGSVLVRPQNG